MKWRQGGCDRIAFNPGRTPDGTRGGLPTAGVARDDSDAASLLGGSRIVNEPGADRTIVGSTRPQTDEPIVAVVIPALNEAGKIGRVLDKLPRDGRFEAIVVDDGSVDGTGDEAREHGAAVVVR